MKLPKSSEAMIEARNKAMQEGLKTAVKTFEFLVWCSNFLFLRFVFQCPSLTRLTLFGSPY